MRSDIIRKALELGRMRGFVTFDQLDELVSLEMTAPEDIEALLGALSDEGLARLDGTRPGPCIKTVHA